MTLITSLLFSVLFSLKCFCVEVSLTLGESDGMGVNEFKGMLAVMLYSSYCQQIS